MAALTKGKIDQAYFSLISSFQKAAQAAGSFAVRRANSTGFISKALEAQSVEVKTGLYLPSWQYRAAGTGKNINIFIRGLEVFACKTAYMTKSTIQVMYLEIDQDDAVPLLALHYDFAEPVLAAHPCFHVQFGVTDVEPQECKAIGLHATIQKPHAPFYPSVRIPTPHMSLGSVLIGIAADHLKPPFSEQFINNVRDNLLKDCETSCPLLTTNLDHHGGHQWHSHHWYDVAKPKLKI